MLETRPEVDAPVVVCDASVVPAIDELVGRYRSREVVPAGEVIDLLLDLRLIAVADEIVTRR